MGARNQYSSINFSGRIYRRYIDGKFFGGRFLHCCFWLRGNNFWNFHDVQNANRRCTGHATMSTKCGNYRLITVHAPFPTIAPNQTSLSNCCWKPWVTDRRWKIQEDVLHEILPKIIVPTRVTHCAFIALWKFYSDHCLKPFCEFPHSISFSFLLQKIRPTQSATIVLTL